MIKNIIFDLGGVILTHKKSLVEDMFSKIFDIPVEKAKSLYLKYKHDLRTGKISPMEFVSKLKFDLQSSKNVLEILKEWELEYIKIAHIDNSILNRIWRELG